MSENNTLNFIKKLTENKKPSFDKDGFLLKIVKTI